MRPRAPGRIAALLLLLATSAGAASLPGYESALRADASGQRDAAVDQPGALSWVDASDLRAAAERSSALVHLVSVRKPRRFLPNARAQPESHPLQELAERTGGRAWIVDSVANLGEAFRRLAATFATRYVLRYEPRGDLRPGWHRLEVKLKNGKARVEARRGYWVPPRTASPAPPPREEPRRPTRAPAP